MDTRIINLEIITTQFRKRGRAVKGYKTVNSLIKNGEVTSLHILLRNHIGNEIISPVEVEERDNIDFLIDYFSILEIGIIANYLPNPLPAKTKKEIQYLLNNEFIHTYFTEHYPQILPQLLLRHVSRDNGEPYFFHRSVENVATLYDRFLILIQNIKRDNDIDQFLWFLDDGWTNNYSISDLWEVLIDGNRIQHKLASNRRHPLNSALWGFIKYIQFLSDFANLLKSSKEDPLLQSAFWHHQAYWFGHMKEKIGDILQVGIKNIKHSIAIVDQLELVKDKNSLINSSEDFEKLHEYSHQLEQVEDDIHFLLNSNFDQPIKVFMKEI